MSDFKFKIPRLPEDVTTERRLRNLPRPNNGDNSRDACCVESRNASQVNVFNNIGMKNYNPLQPIRENIDELTQPSTSRYGNFGEGNNDRDNIFLGSFPKLGNTSVAATDVRTNRNNFMNIENESNYLYKKLSERSLPHSMFGNRPYKYNVNSNSHSNHRYSVVNSRYNNSCSRNASVFNDRSQNDCFGNYKFSSLNNTSSYSLSNSRNPFFSTELLPESSVSRNISVNCSSNQTSDKVNNIESFNRTNLIHKDSTIQFNSNQSALDNQSMVKSVLEASFISIKEQIMNKLENFGQTLLRHDPRLEASFCKVTKEVKSIFNNNSVSMNQVMGTVEMLSTINCTSESIVFPKERMLQYQCGVQPSECSKKPRNVLQEIQFGQSGSHKVTLREEKLKNHPEDDFSDHLDFDSPPSKSDKLKEVNLKNWCPVASGKNLTFTGLNDQNMALQTVTVKKRINNRRVQLINGSFCNLVGNLAKDRKYPTEISKQMTNGLPRYWRLLTKSIAMLQKPSNQSKEVLNDFNHSLSDYNITLRSSRRDPRVEAMKPLNRNDVRKSEDDFCSPKSSIGKAQSKEGAVCQNERQKIAEVKENNNKKVVKTDKRTCSLSSTKKKSSKIENAQTPNENDSESSVLCVTRSGRAVKRPGNFWINGNFNTNNAENKSNVNSSNKTSKGPPKDAQRNQSKRKRDASVKTVVEAKKSKTEKSKTTLDVEEKDENVEIQTTAPTRPEKNKGKEKKPRTKSPIITVNPSKKEKEKKKKSEKKKDSEKREPKEDANPFGNELNEFEDGLNDIFIPEINNEGVKGKKKKLKLLSMETPPLKYLRNNLKILGSCTPVQSPDWQISQHTQSEVKKFEKLRAQAFRQKIPKNNEKGNAGKVKVSAKNKDVDTLMNWISEREVKSPRLRTKVLKYVIPKRDEMEGNEEEEDDDVEN